MFTINHTNSNPALSEYTGVKCNSEDDAITQFQDTVYAIASTTNTTIPDIVNQPDAILSQLRENNHVILWFAGTNITLTANPVTHMTTDELFAVWYYRNENETPEYTLVGDMGGKSQVTGEIYASSVFPNTYAIETEHGTIYRESTQELNVLVS